MAPRSDPRIDEAVAIWFRDDMPNRKAWELAGKPGDEKSIQNIRKCMRMASARADAEAEAVAASPAAVSGAAADRCNDHGGRPQQQKL